MTSARFAAKLLGLVLLQVWRTSCNHTDALNHDAARVTCSGYAPLPSKVLVDAQLHPLNALLVLRPLCKGGQDAHKAVYGLPAVINVLYVGNYSEVCLFHINNDSYSIDIDILARGTDLAGKLTVTCPLPIVSTELTSQPVPPYQHVYKSGTLLADRVHIQCNIDSSVNVTFLPQGHKDYIRVACAEMSIILTVEEQPLHFYISFNRDPFKHCVFRTDIPATRPEAHPWRRSIDATAPSAEAISGVEVSFFKYLTLVEEGTGVIVPCTPPPTTFRMPTTESFDTELLHTVTWSTIGLSTEAPLRSFIPAAVSLVGANDFSTTDSSPSTTSYPEFSHRDELKLLEIKAECGNSTTSGAAWITGVADGNAKLVAVCKSGRRFIFGKTYHDQVASYSLPAFYVGDPSSNCVLNRRVRSEVYAVTVLVSWGDYAQTVHAFRREYQVSCIFGPRAEEGSAVHHVMEPLLSPKVIQHHMGPESESTVTINLVDIFGARLDTLYLGRDVFLTAHSDGKGGELGIQVVGCDAVGAQTSSRYSVIRNGCGDGIVFQRDKGFTTVGLDTRSPYFQAFTLYNSDEISFRCNFTMCSTNCDGSSCGNLELRRKRYSWTDLPLSDEHILTASGSFRVSSL